MPFHAHLRVIALWASLVSGAQGLRAQVFWAETFAPEADALAHWNNGGVNPGPARWAWTDNPGAGYQAPDLPAFAAPGAADGYFYFNSDANGLVQHDVMLTGAGHLANCSDWSAVRLRFFTQYTYFNPSGTSAQVGVSTDGVQYTYHPLFDSLPPNAIYHDWVEVQLPEADYQPQVWLRFRWIGNYEYHWKIDDLTLSGTPKVSCAVGRVGSFSLANEGFICAGDSLPGRITPDSSAFSIPTPGPARGLAWCFSPAPLPPGIWPDSIPGVISTPFSAEITPPAIANDTTFLPYGTYYLTPVVLGAGQLIQAGMPPVISNINPAGACYFVGTSQKITLLPPLDKLETSVQILPEVVPPGQNGAILLTANGGSGAYLNDSTLYRYHWNNGETNRNIAGLTAGAYTVTISDATNCVAPLVLSPEVPLQPSAVESAGLLESVRLSPNPTSGVTRLQIALRQSADIRITVFNAFGQAVCTHVAPETRELLLPIDLGQYPRGIYLLHAEIGNEVRIWKVVLGNGE